MDISARETKRKMKKDGSVSFKQSTLLSWVELRINDQGSACYGAHSHDEFSFGMIDQGRAIYRNRQRSHQIGKGDLVTISPTDVHSCNPKDGQWSYSMLFVDAIRMGEVQQEILQNYSVDYMPFLNDVERNVRSKQTFQVLWSALQEEESLLQVQANFYDFIEASLNKQPVEICDKAKQKSQPDLKHIREKLLDDLSYTYQLDELAEGTEMGRYQLLRAFKNQFGLPPYAYLMDEKIKRAKVMLRSGQELSSIAQELGFSDQAHFQRQFKKKLAVTPKFYQSHFVSK